MILHLLRRAGVAAALLLSLILVATACSAPDEGGGDGGPVQVNTPQGPVTIEHTPKRIVTLGAQWTDTVLAFGVTPVAYLNLTGGTSPWVGDRLDRATTLSTDNLVAEIAKAQPDLILAEGFMATAQPETFAKIRELAPTIPGVSGQQVDKWEDLVTLFGTVTHRAAMATEIIDRVNGKIDQVKVDLPGLKDKTYALAYMFSSDQIQVMADPNDAAGILFAALGMKVAPKIAAEYATARQARFPISTENVPMLESDLLVVTAQTDALRTELRKLPGYANLSAVRDRAVANLSVAEITGLNQPSPLAIPYLLDQMRPQLERAATTN